MRIYKYKLLIEINKIDILIKNNKIDILIYNKNQNEITPELIEVELPTYSY